MAEVLCNNTRLQSINLYGLRQANQKHIICGCACLCHGLLHACTLTGNEIGICGLSALCDALKKNSTLKSLDIGGEVP